MTTDKSTSAPQAFSHVAQLPHGCVAYDAGGRPLIVFPDGSYQRPGRDSIRIPATVPSTSFGPFKVHRAGLTQAGCDEAVDEFAGGARIVAFSRFEAPLAEATPEHPATVGPTGTIQPAWYAAQVAFTDDEQGGMVLALLAYSSEDRARAAAEAMLLVGNYDAFVWSDRWFGWEERASQPGPTDSGPPCWHLARVRTAGRLIEAEVRQRWPNALRPASPAGRDGLVDPSWRTVERMDDTDTSDGRWPVEVDGKPYGGPRSTYPGDLAELPPEDMTTREALLNGEDLGAGEVVSGEDM